MKSAIDVFLCLVNHKQSLHSERSGVAYSNISVFEIESRKDVEKIMHLVSYRGRSAVLSRVLLPRHEPRFNNELELFEGGVAITSATHGMSPPRQTRIGPKLAVHLVTKTYICMSGEICG